MAPPPPATDDHVEKRAHDALIDGVLDIASVSDTDGSLRLRKSQSTSPSSSSSSSDGKAAAAATAPLGPWYTRWGMTRAEMSANDRLNALVRRDVEKLESGEKRVESVPPEVAHVQRTRDFNVYADRFKPFVVFMLVTIVTTLVVTTPSWAFSAAAVVFMYFYVDLYGAILHINLDNPTFLALPGLSQPCLEFQWHHRFPYDIATRSMLDVWGDLNGLLASKTAVVLALYGFDRVAWTLFGAGALLAYTNQFSHRQTHSTKHSALTKWLQANHVLLPPAVHRVHHQVFNDSFAVLNGHSNAVVTRMRGAVENQWVWLAVFAALSFFDVAVFRAMAGFFY